MGSATFSGGFGKRIPNNPSFQKNRGRAYGQQNNTFQGAADLGRGTPMSVAPAISRSEENSIYGLSSEVAASFYESGSGASSFSGRGFNNYAGFWLRVLAYTIDTLFLSFVISVIYKIAGVIGFFATFEPTAPLVSQDMQDPTEVAQLFLAIFLASCAISALITLVYFVAMEASPLQATVGKLALGLRVGDINGNRIGVGRSLCRNLGKFISGLILGIGYVMAGFTSKKQALHDMMCSAYVVK